MARRDSVTARKTTRQSLKLPHQGHSSAFFSIQPTSKGKRTNGIKKEQRQSPLRRSARLDRLIEIHDTQQKTSQQPLPSPVSDVEHRYVSRKGILRWKTDPIKRAHTPPAPLSSKPSEAETRSRTATKPTLSKATANVLS